MIFGSLHFGYISEDHHPDAHAVRAKLSLAVLDSPLRTPWLLSFELASYLMKLAHVSSTCRLSLEEERQLLEHVTANKKQKLLEPASIVCVRGVHNKFYLASNLNHPDVDLTKKLQLACNWEVLVLREEAEGSEGIVAFRCTALGLTNNYISLRSRSHGLTLKQVVRVLLISFFLAHMLCVCVCVCVRACLCVCCCMMTCSGCYE